MDTDSGKDLQPTPSADAAQRALPSSEATSSAAPSGLDAGARPLFLSLLLQGAGVGLAVLSAWGSRRVPLLDWFGTLRVQTLAWVLAITSSFWLLCSAAVYLAIRANVAAQRLAALRSAVGLLVFLACATLSVLQLWYLVLAAGVSPGEAERSGLVLPCLFASFIALWAAEILGIMGALRFAPRRSLP
jgi:hypothetical protein